MNSFLIKKIDAFINKQFVRIGSRAEAEKYGIRGLPPEQQKVPGLPKLPKTSKPPKTGLLPKGYRSRRTGGKLPVEGVIGEVGRQLSPKGRYTSPADIAEDIRESGRLAHKITGIKDK